MDKHKFLEEIIWVRNEKFFQTAVMFLAWGEKLTKVKNFFRQNVFEFEVIP